MSQIKFEKTATSVDEFIRICALAIVEAQCQLDLTQQEMADRLSVCRSLVWRIVNHHRPVSTFVLQEMEQKLGIEFAFTVTVRSAKKGP